MGVRWGWCSQLERWREERGRAAWGLGAAVRRCVCCAPRARARAQELALRCLCLVLALRSFDGRFKLGQMSLTPPELMGVAFPVP